MHDEKSGRLFVRVSRLAEETSAVKSYELVSLDGTSLPRFTAGAHIAVDVPLVGYRHYSIANHPWERQRYIIGVQRQENGRGGSAALHARMRVGAIVKIRAPRNDFPLASSGPHVLIAGGIGITPMLAMSYELRMRRQDFHLWVCTRSPNHTPFRSQLAELEASGLATLHYSASQGRIDVKALVASAKPESHIYCCGPSSLVRTVADAIDHWPPERRHFESFSPPAGFDTDTPFSVTLRSTGKRIDVKGSETLLEALRREGVATDSSCEVGSCRTCRIRYIGGDPIHRDIALSAEERRSQILACVSRAKGTDMILDL